MIVKIESLVIRTEEVVYISTIKERNSKLYWDIDDQKYISKTTYAFKVGLASGDYLVVDSNDYDELTNIHDKIKSNIK